MPLLPSSARRNTSRATVSLNCSRGSSRPQGETGEGQRHRVVGELRPATRRALWTSRLPPTCATPWPTSMPSSSARSNRCSVNTRNISTTDASTRGRIGTTDGNLVRNGKRFSQECDGAPTPPAIGVREHLAAKGLGLHNDLQNESSIVGNFPTVHMMVELGSAEQRAEFLAGLIAGTHRLGFGLTEPDHGSDATWLETTLRAHPPSPPPLPHHRRVGRDSDPARRRHHVWSRSEERMTMTGREGDPSPSIVLVEGFEPPLG
jgi:hypothetical protein